jgi:aspartate aminotransferase, mitochondrial
MAKPDAILGIAQAYQQCTDPRKVNVCVGAYRDENGKPWVLPTVRRAEQIIFEDGTQNKEYLPIDGDRQFVECAMRFAYGPDMPMDHLAGVQTLSGTGACRVGGCFLASFWPNHPIYCPNPTWGNHISIFSECGLDVRRYRYYDRANNNLDLKGMLRDLQKAPRGSIILLHACAHNPTGCDPTIHEWKQIISVVGKRDHVAFFDCAYQGFASGDAEADAAPFRYAVSQRVPILLAQSFAKNFGLYGERCGTLSVVCGDAEQKERILSELRLVIRPMYSSPPRHGSSIVKTILQDEQLTKQYYEECASMALRIQLMRTKLVDCLTNVVQSKHDWSHITRQIGMFAFTGLTPEMCHQLTNEYAIFLTTNGRISIAGLNGSNVEYVAKAIHAVTDGQTMNETRVAG